MKFELLVLMSKWCLSKDGQQLRLHSRYPWWQAFVDIKHNRYGNFPEANQRNVLNTLAALYILEMKMFTKATKEKDPTQLSDWDIPDGDSKVFLYPKWKFRCIDISDPVFEELEV
jgi:hypothetical protein